MSNKIKESNITDGAVTSDKLASGTVANDRLANSSITINGNTVSLGGTLSTLPTITSSSVVITPDSEQSFTLAGTNFVSVPIVELVSSTGAVTVASAVTF